MGIRTVRILLVERGGSLDRRQEGPGGRAGGDCCLHAFTVRATRELFVIDRPLLDWLPQIIVEHAAPDHAQECRPFALGLLGWPVDLNGERGYGAPQEARWPVTRQAEAAKLLRLALDDELIRCGNHLLLDQNRANTQGLRLAQKWSPGGTSEDAALAERAWELASPEERQALPFRVLEGELAPQIDTVRWAQRAAAMGLELAGRSLVYRLSGKAALAIGQPWIICAGSPLEQLRRALQVHARAPWPEPLAPLLRRWLLDEACPFGAPDVPFEEDWDRVADAALNAVSLAINKGGPLSIAELREGVTRLWTIAIALPASVRDRGSFSHLGTARPSQRSSIFWYASSTSSRSSRHSSTLQRRWKVMNDGGRASRSQQHSAVPTVPRRRVRCWPDSSSLASTREPCARSPSGPTPSARCRSYCDVETGRP
ncbi:MAG: hypothetical protein IPG45_00025 [Deltaproteobacteria bacterium]|nr:hypothetical protein [Deltaproteobacteria bacterium]